MLLATESYVHPVAVAREAPHHTVWHSLQHASIWYEVKRWPTTTVRTWCCSLVPLVPLVPVTGFGQWTQHALGYGRFRLGIYAARTRCISTVGAKLQCWKGRVGETHIGVSRGPQTLWPSGQRLKSEITPLGVPQTSFHARVALLLVFSESAIYTIRVVRNFPYHKPSQAFWVYPLRGFISHHVGEPPKCW